MQESRLLRLASHKLAVMLSSTIARQEALDFGEQNHQYVSLTLATC